MESQMKIAIILENIGGELDRAEVNVEESEDSDETVNLSIHEVIEDWILSVGDIIRVVEID